MKNLFFLAVVIMFSACMRSKTGSGNVISDTRNISSFNKLSTAGSVKVNIVKGDKVGVVVETDDNIMPFVETVVSGNTLKIRLKDINNLRNSEVNVTVTVPEIKSIHASAGSEVKSKDIVYSSDKMDLDASSGANININLDAPDVTLSSSSGAEVTAGGRTKVMSAEASSGSSVKAGDLHAEVASGNASSGGSVKIFGSISVDGTASSGGEVRYSGGAATVKKNESSGGSVREE